MTCAHIAASKGSTAVIKELMRFNKVVVTTARNRVCAKNFAHHLKFKYGICSSSINSDICNGHNSAL